MFVDLHSHVVPSGDDGVGSVEEGLSLCRQAATRGTRVLYATPHVWPHLGLDTGREHRIRAAHLEMAHEAATFALRLELGFEVTPSIELLEEDMLRYRLGDLPAVLVDMPFSGGLGLTVRFAEHIETFGLMPVLGHPERADAVLEDIGFARRLQERGWLLQVNSSSLLGTHGPARQAVGWRLVEERLCHAVASDGHRQTRPPFLEEAYDAVKARIGGEADRLFDGSALAARDGVDLAERR
ncbi:MAG TPA: CpsB/CapC family capsule biosynthesis tyrosine phosphatase [Gaiellaceae bacterium]|nr:CpsB/CapC family capsule biosynthesis tyrosine phosphatase [Gaiellaceae bacterium]